MFFVGKSRSNILPLFDEDALDDGRLLLHRRGLYIDQLFKLCSHAVHGRAGQTPRPLLDCLIVVGLKIEHGVCKPYLKLKYPPEVKILC